jgi:hypothetical protein
MKVLDSKRAVVDRGQLGDVGVLRSHSELQSIDTRHVSASKLPMAVRLYLFCHNAPDLATAFIPSLQHVLVGVTWDSLLLRKLETNVFLADGRPHGSASAWAPARPPTKHEVWRKLWTARRAYDVILLMLVLLRSEGSESWCSEGLGQRAGMMGLRLGTVETIWDLPIFVTILPVLSVLPH